MKATQRECLPVAEAVTDSETRKMFLARRCLQDIVIADDSDSATSNRSIEKIIADFDQRFMP